MKKNIVYFENPGQENTEDTIRLAYKKALELNITDIVVVSTHGGTALKTAEIFNDSKFNIIAITISEAYEKEGWTMTEKERKNLQTKGIKVFTGTHALGDDVNQAFTKKFGGNP